MSKFDEVMKKYRKGIVKVSQEYVKAAKLFPYTVDEIKKVFSEKEMKEVGEFILEMRKATASNGRKAELIQKNVKLVHKLLKLGKFLV